MRLALAAAFAAGCAGACSRAEPSAALERQRQAAGPSLAAARAGEPSAAADSFGETAPADASAVAPARADARPRSSAELSAGALLPAEERTWVFEQTAIGRMSVVVLLPERRATDRFPVLIALHGRGEALKGPDRGARGWPDDYELTLQLRRLARPPLAVADFKSFVSAERLQQINAALARQPYRGLVIVCPYTPDMLAGEAPLSKAPPLAGFIVDELLPRVYRDTPALGGAASTGIDGVSLGGRAAWSIGLLRPHAFGLVAGLQAAFDVKDAPELAKRAQQAMLANPQLSFALLTSDEDYFRAADSAIAQALQAAGVPVHFQVAVGPHDYAFNRGPGAIEMLLLHDRRLRAEPAP